MSEQSHRILLVSADAESRAGLSAQLLAMGHNVVPVTTGADALAQLVPASPELAVLVAPLMGEDATPLLAELSAHCPVLVLDGEGSASRATLAVAAGASDYLAEPVTAQALEIALARMSQSALMRRELARWQGHFLRVGAAELIGISPAMQELRRLVGLVAQSDAPVLLRGEGGSGKGFVASSIHSSSPRGNRRMIRVNCGADMSAADLFGGGGATDQTGLIAAAEHGTLYLNDIEKLSHALQARLIGCLDAEGGLPASDGGLSSGASVRFICGSSGDLDLALAEGRLNADLFYRLNTVMIEVPPLRDRPEDIPLLADAILHGRGFSRHVDKSLSDEALDALCARVWPGNIRELANTIERGVIMSAGRDLITLGDLGLGGPSAPCGDHGVTLHFDHRPSLNELRAAYIAHLLQHHDGNRQRTAHDLGISERNLYRLIKDLDSPAE